MFVSLVKNRLNQLVLDRSNSKHLMKFVKELNINFQETNHVLKELGQGKY